MPRWAHLFARWCATLCILVNFLFIPAHSFALTPEEPPDDQNGTILELDPLRGPPGTKVTVKGRGFAKCESSIKLSWDNTLDSKTVDMTGNSFDTNLTVPKNSKPGPLALTASNMCNETTKKFTVTAPPTTTRPSPTTQPSPTTTPQTPSSPATPPPSSSLTPAVPPSDSFTKNEDIAEREIKPGGILYNPPEQMRVGETERVEVRITRQLSAEIYENLQGPGRPRVEELPITAEMKVELIGDQDVFDIRPMSSPIQSVFGSHTEWYWDVIPLSSGTHQLTIKATFIYQGQTFKDLDPFVRNINVAINPVYSTSKWLAGNWDKLLAALGITAAGVFASLYQRLRRKLQKQ